MAGVTLTTKLQGAQEAASGLAALGQQAATASTATAKAAQSSTKAFTEFRMIIRDVTQTVAGMAALMSLFARNNSELQGKLEAVAISLTAVAQATRVLMGAVKLTVTLVGGFVGAIVAAIAIGVALIANWDKVKAAASVVWGSIGKYLKEIWSGLGEIAHGLGNIIIGMLDVDVSKLMPSWQGVVTFLQGVWDGLVSSAKGLGKILTSAFSGDSEGVKQGWAEFKGGGQQLADAFKPVAVAVKEAFDNPMMKAGTDLMVSGAKRVGTAAMGMYETTKKAASDAATTIYNSYLGGNEKRRALEEATADYELRIGKITYAQRISLLEKERAEVGKNAQERLRLTGKIADTSEQAFSKQVEQLKFTALSTDEYIVALKSLDASLDLTKDTGVLVHKKIREELSRLRSETEEFWRQVSKDAKFSSLDATKSVYGVWTQTFEDIFTGAKGFGDGITDLFRGIGKAIMAELAKAVAGKIFPIIAGPGTPIGGLLEGLGGLFGGGKVTAGGTPAGGTKQAAQATDQLALSATDASLAANQASAGMQQVGSTAAGTSGAMSQTTMASLQAAGALVGFAAFLTALSSGSSRSKGLGLVGMIAGAALAFASGGSSLVIMQSAMAGGGIGATLGGMQHGGEQIVTRPTMIRVGEAGAERIRVTPLNGSAVGGSGGMVVQVQGPLVLNDIGMTQFTRSMMRVIQRESGRYG